MDTANEKLEQGNAIAGSIIVKRDKIYELSKKVEGGFTAQLFRTVLEMFKANSEDIGRLLEIVGGIKIMNCYGDVQIANLKFVETLADGLIEKLELKAKKGTKK